MHLAVVANRRPVHYETHSPIIGRWVEVSLYPAASGGLSCYFRDITERKAAEAEREKLLAELSRSNEDLTQFSYVVSHDLQAPLRMVKSYTALLDNPCRDKMDATENQFLDFILEGANRMEELIRGLLSYAQVEERSAAQCPVSLNSLVDGVITTLHGAIEEATATVTRRTPYRNGRSRTTAAAVSKPNW
jgi:light-regulated signal transduction histidine kinase (bacteriophytochrome)